jgi:2-polyprenyl-6-methoxyphenol hydroxylase-like FAD-dependent oxidoreductase
MIRRAISPRLAIKILSNTGLHPEKTESRLSRDRRVERGREGKPEHVAGLDRVDDPVVPESRRGNQLISQYTLEPVLKAAAEQLPTVDVRYGTEFLEFSQDASGVSATVRRSDGQIDEVCSTYLVGCDGGGSPVRKQLGIGLRGEANIAKFRQGLYRCEELFDRLPLSEGPGHGRHYLVADDRSSFLIMQDSKHYWTLHADVETDEEMRPCLSPSSATPSSSASISPRYAQGSWPARHARSRS